MTIRQIKDGCLQGYFLARCPFIWIARLLVPARKEAAGKAPGNVLVIRLDRLGDLVMTMPVIENIKRALPKAMVTVLVRPYLADLAGSIATIDRVIVYDGFLSTARRLRCERFDLAIDMLDDYSLKQALLAFLSAAPRRAGFSGGYREKLFTDAVAGAQAGRSMADIHLDIVRTLGMPVVVSEPRITLREPVPPRSRTVAFHPGGYYPTQRWPVERFAAVARRIAETYDVHIVVIGGPDDREDVATIMTGLAGLDAEERFPDMKGLAMLLAGARLLVCNNSGPLHLAAALGTPTVSTMGPTDPDRWWPRGNEQVVLRGAHGSVDAITADEVREKACMLVDKADGIRRR